LDREPTTIEDLKFVLGHIADIRLHTVERETDIRTAQEMYRTLRMYKHEVCYIQCFSSEHLDFGWLSLVYRCML